MSDIKCASRMKKGDIQKIETYLEKGPSHIIRCLIGIYGKSAREVINFIIKDWISNNIESLYKLGISFTVKNSKWETDLFEDESGKD